MCIFFSHFWGCTGCLSDIKSRFGIEQQHSVKKAASNLPADLSTCSLDEPFCVIKFNIGCNCVSQCLRLMGFFPVCFVLNSLDLECMISQGHHWITHFALKSANGPWHHDLVDKLEETSSRRSGVQKATLDVLWKRLSRTCTPIELFILLCAKAPHHSSIRCRYICSLLCTLMSGWSNSSCVYSLLLYFYCLQNNKSILTRA